MTLGEYIEWMHSKGIKNDDELIFVQDDGSGYDCEISAEPTAENFAACTHFKGLKWENEPKWILGTGTT